jgi:hypothetical protein
MQFCDAGAALGDLGVGLELEVGVRRNHSSTTSNSLSIGQVWTADKRVS